MADDVDQANDLAAADVERGVAAARARATTIKPAIGTCEACLDDDVPVAGAGGILRCTPCRGRWEKRR